MPLLVDVRRDVLDGYQENIPKAGFLELLCMLCRQQDKERVDGMIRVELEVAHLVDKLCLSMGRCVFLFCV
jgi:hypothetical protein